MSSLPCLDFLFRIAQKFTLKASCLRAAPMWQQDKNTADLWASRASSSLLISTSVFPSKQPDFPSSSLQESEGNSSNCRELLLGLGKDGLPSCSQEGFVWFFFFFNARLEKSGEGTEIIAVLTPWYLISNFALNSSLRQLPSLFSSPSISAENWSHCSCPHEKAQAQTFQLASAQE